MKFKIVIVICIIFSISVGISSLIYIEQMWHKQTVHDEQIKDLQDRLTKLENENIVLKQKLDIVENVTSQMFESTWESIAMMNNNFKALGVGYHLKDEDIAPEKYAEMLEEEETNEREGE